MSKKYYLHRISYCAEISYQLLEEKNYLSTGYTGLFDKKLYKIVKNGDTDAFVNHVNDIWGVFPKGAWHLWRFLNFKKGDYIAVPKWGGLFSVYEITGDNFLGEKDLDDIIKNLDGYIEYKKQKDENGDKVDFFWEVKPIAVDISRSEYADATLTKRMHYRGTNVDCDDISNSIESSIKNFKKKAPINLSLDIIDACSNEILKLIKSKLNPIKFEELIKLYFNQCGASYVDKPDKINNKDGDSDIDASFDIIKTIIHVQAKFHEGNTDKWAIEQINDFIKNKSNDDGYSHIGWVISTCDDFSEEAKMKAYENNISLINGKTFAEMLIRAGVSSLEGNI